MIVIEVNSIRRSGHHAFIHWLISNIHETKYDKNLCQSKHTWIKGSNNIMWLNEGEHDEKPWISYINRNIQDIDILIISYESWSKTTMNNPNYSMLTDELREKWGVTEHIQISFVRDFYNNFASLLTRQHHDQDVFENFYTLYRKQLERALTTFRGVIYRPGS